VSGLAPVLVPSKKAISFWFRSSIAETPMADSFLLNNIFKNGIEAVENDTGFKMFRVDKIQFNDEKICDKIISKIKESRFLIADVTEQRQAVYFEAGYAVGMGLPVIWTCKESDKKKCCFDTRQYNHIFWKDAEDLRTKLRERILATIAL